MVVRSDEEFVQGEVVPLDVLDEPARRWYGGSVSAANAPDGGAAFEVRLPAR